jgi:hypothetical protein
VPDNAKDLSALVFEPQTTIIINNIKLISSPNFTPILLKAIENEWDDLRANSKIITDKKLTLLSFHIDCHNSWTNVIDSRSISLTAKDIKEDSIFEGTGKLNINNAYAGKYFCYHITLHYSGKLNNQQPFPSEVFQIPSLEYLPTK